MLFALTVFAVAIDVSAVAKTRTISALHRLNNKATHESQGKDSREDTTAARLGHLCGLNLVNCKLLKRKNRSDSLLLSIFEWGC